MKNLMMSLPKFLKVTPSSNLFSFRLQSTFKRYVYDHILLQSKYQYQLSKKQICLLHFVQFSNFYFIFKMYLFLAKTLKLLSPSQVNSNQNPHLKNWFLVNSLLITCYAFIGHKIKDGQNLELLHFNISKCIQQQKLCIMLKNFMRVSTKFFWKEIFCLISHGSFL